MNLNKIAKGKAQKLRAKGKTYSEIQKILGSKIPKSTLSYWCYGVPLLAEYEEKVKHLNEANLRKAQKMARISNKNKREEFLRNISEKNEHLSTKARDKDVLKMLLAMLYLGEGSKWKSHSGLCLGSSDPQIIQLYLYLLSACYELKSENLKCRISYRADQNIRSLEKYWSKVTLIPLRNFYKTIPDPRTVGKPTKNKHYKGVCVIFGGSSRIQLELAAIVEILLRGQRSAGELSALLRVRVARSKA